MKISVGMLVKLPKKYTFSRRKFRVSHKGKYGFTLTLFKNGKDTREPYQFYDANELIPLTKKEIKKVM